MPIRVIGTTGKLVTIEVLGIAEVIRRIREAGQTIKDSADLGVVQAGGYVEEELKESIGGTRVIPQAVDTGLLANSIQFFKTGYGLGVVKSNPTNYPNSNVSTKDTAIFVEYGTTKYPFPRPHFSNTADRTKDEVKRIIADEIKRNQKFL